MTDESRYCPECVRLQADLEDARTGHGYALLKLSSAYQRGLDEGASKVAVEIVKWLEDLARVTSSPGHGETYLALAKGIMDAEYMPPEEDEDSVRLRDLKPA